MSATIPAMFLVPDEPGHPLAITFRHEALAMAVVDQDQFTAEVAASWDVPGVYLLFGPSAEDEPGRFAVYVGKAAPGSVAKRVRHHVRNREGWDRALLVTRRTDEGFTSTDVGWLEGRLHELLVASPNAELLNEATPGDPTLSDWDREALDRVVRLVLGVMRVLGYRPDPSAEDAPGTPAASPRPAGLDVEALHRLVEALEPGEWTTYGAVAEATGSHPRGIGAHIRACAVGDAPEWRILNARGESQPGFAWGSTSQYAGRSQLDVLAEEGVQFDDLGRADPDAFVDAATLTARLAAAARPDGEPAAEVGRGGRAGLRPLFERGLLRPGAELIARFNDEHYRAVAEADGTLTVQIDGRTTTGSPSATARAITGFETNGWNFWRVGETPLARLRDQ